MVKARSGGFRMTALVLPVVLLLGVALSAWMWATVSATVRAPVAPVAPVVVVAMPAAAAPLRNDARALQPNRLPSYAPSDFQQVGLLTSDEGDKDPLMLPLFGKKLTTHHNRWQYYAASDKPSAHLWRLPMQVNKRVCSEDIGCDEIYEGDSIEVPVYKDRLFTAHIYRIDAPQYQPFVN